MQASVKPAQKPHGSESKLAGESAGVQVSPAGFPVVGVGASAGSVEAFFTLLKKLPANTGMSFVLVPYADPAHVAKATRMPVSMATDGAALEPDHVYVLPPNTNTTIRRGVLKLAGRGETDSKHLPIDCFFRALAEDRKTAAIGVVLSGVASDGARGLRAIRAEGGITFAQDERSARRADSCADYVLPPEKIAAELARMVHPCMGTSWSDGCHRICVLLRSATGVDFQSYRPPVILRGVTRRMVLGHVQHVDQYVQLLHRAPAELGSLHQDILAHVTGFFRDPEAFQALRSHVVEKLEARGARGEPIRVWVPGCSSGEEVYSIAMLLAEALGEEADSSRIRIFGTDISEPAIAQARAAVYPEPALESVSLARLRRFFSKVEGGHQIARRLREMCVFCRHDVAQDTPLSRLDLISCRNVLILMGPALQRKVVATFHYALKPDGHLFLGKSESLEGFTHLFVPVERANKIFARNPAVTTRLWPGKPAAGDSALEYWQGQDKALLQMANEELAVAREDLASSNEELATLNAELRNHNAELSQLTNDLTNLLAGVHIPILMLDNELRIRRFTPMAGRLLGLSWTDVGRPFEHSEAHFTGADWDSLIADVREGLSIVEREVQDREGHWYMLRMRPYSTPDSKIEGVLIAFLDIDAVRRSLEEARRSRDYAEAIVDTVQEGLVVLDGELRIITANRSFYQTLRVLPEAEEGRSVLELGDGQWDVPRLRRLLGQVLSEDSRIEDYETDYTAPSMGNRHVLLNARQIHQEGAGTGRILLAIRDVTESKRSQAVLLKYQQELQALTARLISAQETESKRLARELHDAFSQKLAALSLEVANLRQKPPASMDLLSERLQQVGKQIETLARDIHQVSRQLHPAILDDLGLVAALRNECVSLSQQHGVPVEFKTANVPRPLSEAVSLCLYRVAQESLWNIVKHARPTQVRVWLTTTGDAVDMVIEDVAGGFDPAEAKAKGGLGLVSMEERVRLVNGSFSIRSRPGEGTRVEVRVPWQKEE